MDFKETTASVLMLPWLAHGHISPFLELAKRLVHRNFHIYMCSTAINLSSIKKRITGHQYSDSIELLELQFPSSPELPPEYHTTNGLPPHLMRALKNAYESASPHFSDLLNSVHPDLVIYDFNQPWAAETAASQNIPAVQFLTGGTAILCFGFHMLKKPGEDFPFPEIYLREYERQNLHSQSEIRITDDKDIDRFLQAVQKSCGILLVKSCREIEGKYMDLVSDLSEKKLVPVGTLVQDLGDDNEQTEIIQWLDKKDEASVVFASFGSEYFLTKEERNEIARGLELSEVNFIWVIRFPFGEKTTIEEALPQVFLEGVGDRGRVVEGWAPQARILRHSSIGGFLSHCGWSSVMESMKFGVPIVAMPMHIDQPLNARLVEAVGVGVEALRDDKGKLQSEEIAKAIRKVVVDESGEDVRMKAKQLSEKLELKDDEEIDTLVEELGELCRKYNKQC